VHWLGHESHPPLDPPRILKVAGNLGPRVRSEVSPTTRSAEDTERFSFELLPSRREKVSPTTRSAEDTESKLATSYHW